MSVQDLVEYPRFADLEAKVQKSQTFNVLLTIYWVILALVGFGAFAFSSSSGSGAVLVGFGALGLAALFFMGARKARRTVSATKIEIGNQTSAYLASERKRLEDIKSSMTAAEWENYKLQLENQRLLRQIKNTPASTRTTTTSTTSWVAEVGD
jgi:flagellar basal body-associated protein FliL